MPKRAATDLSLVIGIDKPAGMTSHDVVARLRRILGEKRIGHAGTLDPAATGVLVACVGPATRLVQYLTGHGKEYAFTVAFGTATDTDDAEGAPVRTAPLPERGADPQWARGLLARFTGELDQLPPAYSAIKVEGRKLYEHARAGAPIEVEPRRVRVDSLALERIEEGEGSLVWHLRASVSAGTYIRSLARDLGEAAGSAAHVGELRRVRSGSIGLADCIDLQGLEALMAGARPGAEGALREGLEAGAADARMAASPCDAASPRTASATRTVAASPSAATGLPEALRARILDPVSALGYPVCEPAPAERRRIENGGAIPRACAPVGSLVSVADSERLLAVYRQVPGALRPACIFPKGVSRG